MEIVFLVTSVLASLIISVSNPFSMKFTIASILLLLLLASTISTLALANTSVGVKKGDWVEYNVTFTGNPPLDHDAAWAKMEVINVEGKKVNATFYSRLANGTALSIVEDLNFETGRLIDLFIIPAGLKTGEIFYDHTVGQIAIDATEIRTYAGAARTVVHAEAVDTQWYWDKATGVTLEARTSNSIYTLDTIAVSTGLWGPQILGLDQTVFYGLTILLVTVAIAATIVVITYRRRKTRLSKL